MSGGKYPYVFEASIDIPEIKSLGFIYDAHDNNIHYSSSGFRFIEQELSKEICLTAED